jgi:3-ketosteroid 9alpha-monooxygenase subunit A
VTPEYVIENVFDAEHFESVHKVSGTPRLTVSEGSSGELVVLGELRNRLPNAWQEQAVQGEPVVTRVVAHVVSPTLVLTELGTGQQRYAVVTGATPTASGCVIRVAALVPRGQDGAPVDPWAAQGLLRDSRTAFEQDITVWEHLIPGAPHTFDERDAAVLRFRAFCESFGVPPLPRSASR